VDVAWANEELHRRFSEIAALLKLLGADRFRVRAYERAADAIGAAPVDLSTLSPEEVAGLKGIGKATAAKIAEYLDTGAITMLEELRGQVAPGVIDLTRVPGLGPKTAAMLNAELGIDSIESLREAIGAGRLRDLPGLGAKTEQNLLDGLERMGAKDTNRLPVAEVIAMAEELVRQLRQVPEALEVTYAGSLRRMRETIGDIDILVAGDDPAPIMDALRTSGLVIKVLAAGEKKTSVLTVRAVQADLRVVEPEAWGAALVYFTGSKAHNVRIRERAVRRGLMLNEYGLFRRTDEGTAGERLASRTEEDVYGALDLQWVPPTMREDTGEVDAAAGTLPAVVTVEDLRGDLHGHTTYSGDGKATLEEMVAAAAARGYAYWAVTDHAENLTINGIDRARMLEQRRHIERLQESYPGMRILHGAELNIDLAGDIDYDEEFLLGYDFTVASVHSFLNRPAAEQTHRLVKAMEHPAVNVIGHPTGRKITRRPGYTFDVDAVMSAAVRTGTALEVNASPWRLDLGGELVRAAVDAGVQLAISCDAHSIGDLDSMRYGVATAQRGWATPADVLNCRELDGLLDFVAAKRS
jgi:DNA polymerase (family X)